MVVIRGRATLLGIQDNFYNVAPPPMPAGWAISVKKKNVARKAEILINARRRSADINLDIGIFSDPDVPKGCKVFMFFHELGHLVHGPAEHLCDEFAFMHSLRAGVSPFLCFLALYAFMPEHYNYRVERLRKIILANPQLKNQADEQNYGYSC